MQRSGSSELATDLATSLGCDNLNEPFWTPLRENLTLDRECRSRKCWSNNVIGFLNVQRERVARATRGQEVCMHAYCNHTTRAHAGQIPNATCVILKIFDSNFEYQKPGSGLVHFLGHSQVRPLLLERFVQDRFCSYRFALQTKDWTGHLEPNGTRHHPPGCSKNHAEFPKFSRRHEAWYTWLLTAALRRKSFLALNFSSITRSETKRALALETVRAFAI